MSKVLFRKETVAMDRPEKNNLTTQLRAFRNAPIVMDTNAEYLCHEAADEIERLQDIHKAALLVDMHVPFQHIVGLVTQGHYKALRAALDRYREQTKEDSSDG